MSELWLFKILTSEAKAEVEAETEVKTEARYITGVPYEGSRENPRYLSSPKAEKFATEKLWTDRPTDIVTYTIRWSRIKRVKQNVLFLARKNQIDKM